MPISASENAAFRTGCLGYSGRVDALSRLKVEIRPPCASPQSTCRRVFFTLWPVVSPHPAILTLTPVSLGISQQVHGGPRNVVRLQYRLPMLDRLLLAWHESKMFKVGRL